MSQCQYPKYINSYYRVVILRQLSSLKEGKRKKGRKGGRERERRTKNHQLACTRPNNAGYCFPSPPHSQLLLKVLPNKCAGWK